MTDVVLKVSLWGEDVAAVVWDKERESAVFEFFPEFATANVDISPLIMPLDDIRRGERTYFFPSLRNNSFKGLPGLLADSLPDAYGDQILEEYFASRGLNGRAFSPVDRLCYVGKRGMGALEFEPSRNNPLLNESSVVEIAHLTELAKEVLGRRSEFQAELAKGDQSLLDIIRVGTSAGGAKPKAIIATNSDMSEVRSGQVAAPEGFTYWLLKFDGVEAGRVSDNPLGIGRIEYAYHRMALDCGINMTECRLFEDGEYAHFMTKRFDRTDTGEKLHTQTLCGIAHFDRDDRHSYEQAFEVMRRMGLPYPDMEQMYRRMVFNIVARNHDDHTKNHSFILRPGGEWRLAPAYDLCYSYSSAGRWTNRHQMSANNKRDDFTRQDLLTVAQNMGIKNAKSIVEQVSEVVSLWPRYASEVGVKVAHREQIARNLRLF
jgi:serine/threonine-protein kinase HipA